jgi:hypothetical protein
MMQAFPSVGQSGAIESLQDLRQPLDALIGVRVAGL